MTIDKTVFVDHFEGEYSTFKAMLDEFRLKMHLGGMEARDLKKKVVDDLHHGLEHARQKLHEVQKSSGDGYRKLLFETEKIWHELGDKFRKAGAHFQHEKEDESS